MSEVKPDSKNSNQKPSDISELQAKLDAANKIIQQKDAENAELKAIAEANKDSSANRKVRGAADINRGEGYKFRVGLSKPHAELPDEDVEACDESEAIRWFILTHSHPDRPGVQIDPSVHPIKAKCIDPRKDVAIKQSHMIAKIRRKADSGVPVSEDEQTLLDAADEKILNMR